LKAFEEQRCRFAQPTFIFSALVMKYGDRLIELHALDHVQLETDAVLTVIMPLVYS